MDYKIENEKLKAENEAYNKMLQKLSVYSETNVQLNSRLDIYKENNEKDHKEIRNSIKELTTLVSENHKSNKLLLTELSPVLEALKGSRWGMKVFKFVVYFIAGLTTIISFIFLLKRL